MTIEIATYTSQLNSALPAATDSVGEGENHIQLIKSAIKATWANITGAVTSTHLDFNWLTSARAALTVLLTSPPWVPSTNGSAVAFPLNGNYGLNGNLSVTGTLVSGGLIYENGAVLLPGGIITLWFGSTATIPGGWLLCNGANSTPDLRAFTVGGRVYIMKI